MSTTSVPHEPLQPERRGMSTGAKVLLALVTVVILLGTFAIFLAFIVAGTVAFGIARTVETGSAEVGQTASEIAAFDPPASYDESFAINALGFSMVGYDGVDGNSHIMFAQVPAWVRVDRAELERQARANAHNQNEAWDDYRFEIVGEQVATIRGEEVTMTIGEGTNHEGDAYREIIAPFEGRGGQAVLIIVEPIATWDQARIDAFIASIQ